MKEAVTTIMKVGVLGLAMALGVQGSAALADTINVTYLAPGVESPAAFTTYYETFDSNSIAVTNPGVYSTDLVTTFNGSSITGTYSGSFAIHNASVNGGAGTAAVNSSTPDSSGHYILAPGGDNYTLTLSSGVNYFGIWISALDAGNVMTLYDGSTVLYTLTSQDLTTLIGNLGNCPSSSYCGNPNNPYKTEGGSADSSSGDNNLQLYAYVNFYDTTGDNITKVTFTEPSGGANFESDNQSAAILASAPGGTSLGTNYTPSVTPEPSSLLLLGTGLVGGVSFLRRRRSATTI